MSDSRHLAYLQVDRFMATLPFGVALERAFTSGIIDQLEEQTMRVAELQRLLGCDLTAIELLLGLLRSAGVVEVDRSECRLTGPFRQALPFRELMVAKLAFARQVASDFGDHFAHLLSDPQQFFEASRLFDLFDYSRCFEVTRDNLEATRRWVTITTALTRYETPPLLQRHDFGRYRKLLDIGGNSGELSRQLCRENDDLTATVVDLPVVCAIGREHVAADYTAERIAFVDSESKLPADHYDIVIFKSMLHDWPDDRVADLIRRGYRSLKPGGTLLIYERGPFDIAHTDLGYGNLPLLLFFRAYVGPERYRTILEGVGLAGIEVVSLQLDMPFFILTAKKV